MTKIPTGRFVWFEHVSKTPEKAQRFLGELFNWTTAAMPMGDGGTYTMIKSGDVMLGGYPPIPGNVDVPAHWVAHLQTDNAVASAKLVKANGGKVVVEPVEMGGMGTYALVTDPLGGAFALWQPAKVEGTGDYKDVPGAFCWNELFTEDPAKSVAFYQAIGGFELEKMAMPGVEYNMLKSDGKPRAGIMKTPMPGLPQMWLPYVQVANIEASHERAKKLGGDVKVPPTDIPNVGRFAIVVDPVGAAIGLLQPLKA